MFTLTDAILKLRPNSSFQIEGDALEGLTFLNDSKGLTKPTQVEVNNTLQELESDAAKAEVDKAKAKASAETKLAALGLTADEVAAIVGH